MDFEWTVELESKIWIKNPILEWSVQHVLFPEGVGNHVSVREYLSPDLDPVKWVAVKLEQAWQGARWWRLSRCAVESLDEKRVVFTTIDYPSTNIIELYIYFFNVSLNCCPFMLIKIWSSLKIALMRALYCIAQHDSTFDVSFTISVIMIACVSARDCDFT